MVPKSESQKLAIDTIERKKTKGIPTFLIHPMDFDIIEEVAEVSPGSYEKDPEGVYLKFQLKVGTNVIDQFIPTNPLTMTKEGFKNYTSGATTGAKQIIVDGMIIDSPEKVCEHLEKFVFPKLKKAIEEFDEEKRVKEIMEQENLIQEKLGNEILKTGYGYIVFPAFRYYTYGYLYYFMTYALYPEIIEKDFSLQADYAELNNKAAAKAILKGDLPRLYRLDHDMAYSSGPMVNMKSLEKLWVPNFERAIKPIIKEVPDMNLIWHCDGNLMPMVPILIECGVKGFQGFQYEFGMDYEKICKMRTKDGETLIIVAGVSVTKTLPFGTPEDVKKEMKWLVEYGPEVGLFLAGSSSITPKTKRENILTFIEGLKYYRENGKQAL